jgi:hypothetical protein
MKAMRTAILLAAFFGGLMQFSSCGFRPERPDASADQAQITDSTLLARGHAYLATAQDSLRKHLIGNIQSGGAASAIEFCNVHALPLLNSPIPGPLSIKRTSIRYRNVQNAPDSAELAILDGFQKLQLAKQAIEPLLFEHNGTYHYYEPILMQPLCLQCHGKVDADIAPETLAVIDTLYPTDRARNYSAGDLRGMFHIAFQ